MYKRLSLLIGQVTTKRRLTTLRIGVCNYCTAVINEVNAQNGKVVYKTESHHEEYDDIDPLAHTIEACPECHPHKLELGGGVISYIRSERQEVTQKVCKR